MSRNQWPPPPVSNWVAAYKEKQRKAWEEGVFDHTPDKNAPWSHPARSGYLLPRGGEAEKAHQAYRARIGARQGEPMSDQEVWDFEDEYIRQQRAHGKTWLDETQETT